MTRARNFGALLREFRDQRRLSQSRLAEHAGFDHSYVSRLETDGRQPSIGAVQKLAEAMGLNDADRDALLLEAGFAPGNPLAMLDNEPVLGELAGLLSDPIVPVDIRDDVRAMIRLIVKQAQRTERRLHIV